MQNIFDEEPKPEDKYDLFKNDKPFVKKTLSRSKKNKIFLGVSAGLADYYSVNANLVRLLFALSILLGGLGAVLYLILFFFVTPHDSFDKGEISEKVQLQNKVLLGITMVTVGFYFIIMPTNYFPFAFMFFIPTKILFPIVFLLAGIWIQKNYRLKTGITTKDNFQRSIRGRLFLGVCIGLAEYLGTYALVVRLLFVIFTFATLGVGIIIYFIIALLSKQKRVVIIE
ncbi:MAG: PspC domain-containing protein [Candidatus Heimdallarchaeota archaeon]